MPFNANGTLTGQSSTNDLMGKYTINPNTMSAEAMTERGEVYDGYLYVDCLQTICSFSIVDGCLRLYYDNRENYLSYKRVQETLVGKWKLVGIVNAETGEIKELEPKGEPRDEECYTFIFNANGTLTGQSSTNDLMGKYTINPNTMSAGAMTERGEVYDGYLYVDCLQTICSFSIVDGCLRLYYDNRENYLSYKRVQETLVGKWKLVGIVNAETGEIKELEPKDCEECYTLTFTTGTKAEVLVYREKRSIDLSHLGQIIPLTIPFATEEDEYFIEALLNRNTKSYTVTSIELKFINDVENYYLLFKPQKL